MRRLFFPFIILIAVLFLLSSQLNAKSPAEDKLIQKIREIMTPATFVPQDLPSDFHPVCATRHFAWIPIYMAEFKNGMNLKSLGILDRPDSSYSVPESTYNTPGGNFKIHYVTSSVDSVYQSHVDVSPADGIPDYVNLVGTILDYVWAKEVDTLGYNQPPSDSWYTLYGYDNGGDGRYDVYLKNLSYYYLGFSQPEYSNVPPYKSYCSYIVLRNDYSLYGGSWQNYLKPTSGHEFFHAIQFGYDAYEQEYVPSDPIWQYHPYWMEITATWMEDIVYDDINDYVSYLTYFYNYPWYSLKAFSYDSGDPKYYHGYAACVWAIYLSEKFGVSTVKDIWTKCGQTKGDNVLPATDTILINKGSSLSQAFREFSVWNYFTSSRADVINYYSEGNLYPLVKFDASQVHYGYPVNVSSVTYPPEVLGTNYISFVVDTDSSGGLDLHFDGSDSAEWKVSVIGYSSVNPEYFEEFSLNGSQAGDLEFHNWVIYDNIIMIPAVVTRTSGSFNYSYSAAYDSSLTDVEEQPGLLPFSFNLWQNHPNPFNSNTTVQFRVGSSGAGEPVRTVLSIYNLLGQKIRALVDKEMIPGTYRVVWNGEDQMGREVCSGIYFYRLEAGDYSEMKKMILIK